MFSHPWPYPFDLCPVQILMIIFISGLFLWIHRINSRISSESIEYFQPLTFIIAFYHVCQIDYLRHELINKTQMHPSDMLRASIRSLHRITATCISTSPPRVDASPASQGPQISSEMQIMVRSASLPANCFNLCRGWMRTNSRQTKLTADLRY